MQKDWTPFLLVNNNILQYSETLKDKTMKDKWYTSPKKNTLFVYKIKDWVRHFFFEPTNQNFNQSTQGLQWAISLRRVNITYSKIVITLPWTFTAKQTMSVEWLAKLFTTHRHPHKQTSCHFYMMMLVISMIKGLLSIYVTLEP